MGLDQQLLHDLEHEFATILLLVAAVRGDDTLGSAARHRLELIEREVDCVRGLVGSAAEDREPGDEETADVRGILADVVDARRRSLDTDVVLVAPRPARARILAPALRRLVANLVDNAVHAAGPGGRVEVVVTAGPPVVVRVVDDGPGWGGAPVGGRGLGLGIVGALAEELGAAVRITPGSRGGTVAEVTLAEVTPAEVPEPVPTPREGAVG